MISSYKPRHDLAWLELWVAKTNAFSLRSDRQIRVNTNAVCNRDLSIPHDKLRRVVLHPPAPDPVAYVTTGNLANECVAKISEALIAFKMLLLSN